MKRRNVVLSDQQSEAVSRVSLWYAKPVYQSQIFYLAGYAGTGKTTIIPYILDELGINESEVCFATYTGKASLVMSASLGEPVSTIHSLCYELRSAHLDEDTGKVDMRWRLRKESPLKLAKLLILDEVSFVNTEMMRDLKSFCTKILVLGDPFQLMPVEGDAYFHEGYQPDFFLTEIHRQALENPLIWLSMQVRNRNEIGFGQYGNAVTKIHRNQVQDHQFLEAEQIIVGTNETRRNLNQWYRNQFDRTDPFPCIGDRLICLRNRWDDGLVNGMMLEATSIGRPANNEVFKLSFETCDKLSESRSYKDMKCSTAELLNRKSGLSLKRQRELVSIDYGYAITCHKAQGSQYKSVLFLDENFGKWSSDNTYYRHLYTAITRAAETLVIVAK